MQKHEEEERRQKADEAKKQKAELKQRRREEHARLQAEKKAQEEREREREQAEQGLYYCFTQSICHIDLSSFFFTEEEMDVSKEEKNSVQTSSRPCCSCGKT